MKINKLKIIKIKKAIMLVCILLSTICFSCSKAQMAEVPVTSSIEKATEKVEYKVVETEKAFVAERIDLSDVSGDLNRNNLAKIDELNRTLGEPVYITKEDYFKYKDANVSLIGDSIAEFSKTFLHRFLRNMFQDSVPGREMSVGIEAFDNMNEIGRVGDIMILSLGNNAIKGIDTEVLEYVYNGLEGRPLIIPTIVMPYAGQERNRNRDLINFVNTHDNCYLADWNKVARMGEDFIKADGVHPSGEGSEAYAQVIFKTVIDVLKEKEK